MRYRAFKPNASWYQISWDHDRADPPSSWAEVLAIPGVRYHPRAIEFPATCWMLSDVVEFCKVLGVVPPELYAARYSTVRPWAPARAVLAHQPELTLRLLDTSRVLCADGMGLGKTGAAIQAAETVRRHIHHHQRPVFVFGPLRLRKSWQRELYVMGALEAPEDFCALESLSMDDPSWRPGAKWYFVHYDVISAWWSRLALLRPCVTILDEGHLLKNGKTKRTKATSLAFQGAPFRMCLTGTPIQNKPQDLWSILTMLTGERTWGGPVEYRQRYCGSLRNDFGWQDMEPTNVQELQERLAPFWLRRTLESAGVELPPFRREIVEVAPSPLRKQTYRTQLSSMSAAQVASIVQVMLTGAVVPDTLKLIAKLRKVTSDAKLDTTIELCESILAQDGAVVVFTWERRVAEKLAETFGKRPAITGNLDIRARDMHIDDFQANGGLLAATYGALAEGVTLHRARCVIQHDMDWVPSTMLQAEKRIHRIGQAHACTSYWMTAPKLFDAFVLDALRHKLNDTELVLALEEAVPELTRDNTMDDFEARLLRDMQAWRES